MSPLVPHDFSDTFLTSLKPLIPCLILGTSLLLYKENKYNNTDTTAVSSQNITKFKDQIVYFDAGFDTNVILPHLVSQMKRELEY